MNNDQALVAAEKAWEEMDRGQNCIYKMFDKDAFMKALQAYMMAMMNKSPLDIPKADNPTGRTLTEHFLALCSGGAGAQGYGMTTGRTGSVGREVIYFQPNPKSSILIPLFMSVHNVHDALTDTQGRKLDVEIKP